MEKKLFLDMVDLICDSFSAGCKGCPLKDLRRKKGCSSCEYFLDHYQNDVELVLATWIGGVDFVETLGEQERKKTPETRREILQAAEAGCAALDEARENANEACAKWEGMYRMALERAEKAEKCIDSIEDDLDRGNENDWAREHIREYRTAKEE